jgi:hypothetical protein
MKTIALIAFVNLLAGTAAAQPKASPAKANPPKAAPAKTRDAYSPAGKIFAQKLVEDTLDKHPELLIFVFHVTPPGKTKNIIIASNIGRIGKEADEDDLRVINTGKPNLELNSYGDHFEVEMALKDGAGKTIGALATVFAYKEGDDKEKLHQKGEAIRLEIEKQIPANAKLFEVVK